MLIEMPLPPQELAPNARSHYMKKARATKMYRTCAMVRGHEQRTDDCPFEAADVFVTFFVRDKGRRDRDNLLASLKSAFDGIADAGIVRDDANFTYYPVGIEVDRENQRVEIRIERTAQ